MIALKVEDIKQFTSSLFIGTIFDHFLIREANIVTFNEFHINGRIQTGYYTKQEMDEKEMDEYSKWEFVKPVCFFLIRGKRLPGSFQIILQLGRKQVEEFLAGRQLTIRSEQVGGMYLNIRYEAGELYCITGTSIQFFTFDKSLETEWDEAVKEFFKEKQIPFSLN